MEALGILEKKLTDLVELVKKLKNENGELLTKNDQLANESKQLQEKLEQLEVSELNNTQELNQEKQMTKMVVEGLIKSIDSLVENESV